MTNRIDLLNALIQRFGFTSYLEIGTQKNVCLNQIKCNIKVGIDPKPIIEPSKNITRFCKMTSDLYFKMFKEKFDLIFIDGLHHSEQVYKDIKNALKCLTECGIIVCHDMNPQKEEEQRIPRETKHWNGDCWKAWVRLRNELNRQMFVVDIDEGCGIITDGIQVRFNLPKDFDYKWLEENRKEALNLISVKQFIKWLNS